jgi:hypothetical protein
VQHLGALSRVLRHAEFEIVTHRYVADADPELWLIARDVGSPRPTTITAGNRLMLSARS